MSRQQWACLRGGQHHQHDDWRTLLHSRTSDPEAADLGEAIQLFRSGLRQARHGRIDQAVRLIACAYLLDCRSVTFLPVLPKENREEAAYRILDMIILQRLIDCSGTTTTTTNYGSQIMMIYAAIRLGHLNTTTASRIVQALAVSDRLLAAIHADPTLETTERGVLGGCMKRTTLHRMRCSLYLIDQQNRKALQELTAALRIDPSLATVRCLRACLYASLSDTDITMAAQEFRQFVADCHADSTELPIAYAWLAKLLVASNCKLGTYEQAEVYWGKSRRAAIRYKELYGEESTSPIETEMLHFFGAIQAEPSFQSEEQEGPLQIIKEDPICVVCARKNNREGGRLFQCSRCKDAHYCSGDCQREVSRDK